MSKYTLIDSRTITSPYDQRQYICSLHRDGSAAARRIGNGAELFPPSEYAAARFYLLQVLKVDAALIGSKYTIQAKHQTAADILSDIIK
jgi:hypothetical protein